MNRVLPHSALLLLECISNAGAAKIVQVKGGAGSRGEQPLRWLGTYTKHARLQKVKTPEGDTTY